MTERKIFLDAEGQKSITTFVNGMHIDGMLSDIKVRRYDESTGIVTYGVKLRGFTGGNFDLEIPLFFSKESGKISDPVIGFVQGQAILLSEAALGRLLGSANLTRKFAPGWMNIHKLTNEPTFFVFNPENKYASKPEHSNSESDYYIAKMGSKRQVKIAMLRMGLDSTLCDSSDTLQRMLLAFGSRLGFEEICKIAADPEQMELPFEDEPEQLGFEWLEEETPEEIPEETEEPVEEKLIIEAPEDYRKIVFPSIGELLEIIRLYRLIKFVYRKLNDEWVFRTTEPHYLWKTKKGNIIMIAWDKYREDWRAFDIARLRDVEVLYNKEWRDLGQFIAILEKAKDQQDEHLLQQEAFSPRGPYHDYVTNVRGSLKRLAAKSGGPLRQLLLNMSMRLSPSEEL